MRDADEEGGNGDDVYDAAWVEEPPLSPMGADSLSRLLVSRDPPPPTLAPTHPAWALGSALEDCQPGSSAPIRQLAH